MGSTKPEPILLSCIMASGDHTRKYDGFSNSHNLYEVWKNGDDATARSNIASNEKGGISRS